MQYHHTIGEAIQELFRSYEEYYGIYDTFYALEPGLHEDEIRVTIGIAPQVEQMGGGRAGTMQTHVLLKTYNLDSIESARADIPKIHKAFIRELHSIVRRKLIHMYSHKKEL